MTVDDREACENEQPAPSFSTRPDPIAVLIERPYPPVNTPYSSLPIQS